MGVVRKVIRPVVRPVIDLGLGAKKTGQSWSSYWTPQYEAVYQAMTAAGSQPSNQDAKNQSKWLKTLIQLGVFDKSILINNFAAHSSAASLFNWKNPALYKPQLVGAVGVPNFTAYKGFKGDSVNRVGINLSFTPSTDGAGFLGDDDISFIIGVSDNAGGSSYPNPIWSVGTSTKKLGCYGAYNNNALAYLNSEGNTGTGVRSLTNKRYLSVIRNNADTVELYRNLARHGKGSITLAMTGLCDLPLYALYSHPYYTSNNTITFILICKALTEEEVQGVVEACDEYLSNYGTAIRAFPTSVRYNLVDEGHSFVSGSSLYNELVQNSLNTYKFYLPANGGEKIEACINRASVVDSKLLSETSTLKNVMCLWVGTNDFTNATGQGTTIYNQLKGYVQARIAAGWKVIAHTCTPKTKMNETGLAERIIFNNLMRSDLSLLSNVKIVDTDTIAELNNPADTTYYGDGVHPTLTGYQLVFPLFVSKFNEMFGEGQAVIE